MLEPQYNSMGVRLALARMIRQDVLELGDNLTAAESAEFAHLLDQIEQYENLDAPVAA